MKATPEREDDRPDEQTPIGLGTRPDDRQPDGADRERTARHARRPELVGQLANDDPQADDDERHRCASGRPAPSSPTAVA